MAYKPSCDKTLFFTAGILTIFGLVMVYSASFAEASTQHGMSSYFFMRQMAYALLGFLSLIFMMNVDYHLWQKPKLIGLLIIVCLIALGLVLFQPKVNGAHRWLRYGNLISFQPSEAAKLAVLIFIAAFLDKYESEINQPTRRLLPLCAVVGLVAGLIVIEPDFGQAVCICLIAAILLMVAGLSWKYFAAAVLLSVPAFFVFIRLEPYRWERIKAFLDPFQDPLGSGWQISNSLIAVGSGGFWGLGLGAGKQKLFFLPEASSDFIFAVIGEELGLIATSLLTLAFLLFFYRGMKAVLRSPDRFGFYLGLGITLMVALQAFINISMVLAIIPTKGIGLPCISTGGTSLLLNLLATGILLNLSHQGRTAEAAE